MKEFIIENKIEVRQFKDNRPGMKWMKNFMKRNKLSHKKAEMISVARKSNTSNPFLIYDFYDQLEKVWRCLCTGICYNYLNM